MFYIYKLTNTVNGKAYIGATTLALVSRMSNHRSSAKTKLHIPLYKAVAEFGWEAFELAVLHEVRTVGELAAREIEAIKEHGTMEPNGYNQSSGGAGCTDRRSLESTRLAISTALTGRPLSDEHKAKLSLAKIGKPGNATGTRGHAPWNKGVARSEEDRAKMRAGHARILNPKCRAIELNGIIYPSIIGAARESGLTEGQVRHRLSTGRARYISPPHGGKSPKETTE